VVLGKDAGVKIICWESCET